MKQTVLYLNKKKLFFWGSHISVIISPPSPSPLATTLLLSPQKVTYIPKLISKNAKKKDLTVFPQPFSRCVVD